MINKQYGLIDWPSFSTNDRSITAKIHASILIKYDLQTFTP